MTRLFTHLCLSCALTCALACGRTDRDVGSYTPQLGQAGESATAATAGAAGAPSQIEPPEGGTPLDLSKPWNSTGCGRPLPAKQLATRVGSPIGFTEWRVNQVGATLAEDKPTLANARKFYVRVPPDYDPNRPYRVVYLMRRACSLGVSDTTSYALYDESLGGSEQAVYVDVAVAEEDVNPHCYDTGTGLESMEYEAFDLIHAFVESHYCVDNNRIFVAGSSQGGALSNMWGCYFGGTPNPPRKFAPKWAIRGHAVLDGWREPNQPLPCGGPGAALWIQETGDLESGDFGGSNPSALLVGLSTNGCAGNFDDGPKQSWAPAANVPGLQSGVCQLYTGCSRQSQSDFPLVFCSPDGMGGADRADLAIPAFTAFFNSMDPTP